MPLTRPIDLVLNEHLLNLQYRVGVGECALLSTVCVHVVYCVLLRTAFKRSDFYH